MQRSAILFLILCAAPMADAWASGRNGRELPEHIQRVRQQIDQNLNMYGKLLPRAFRYANTYRLPELYQTIVSNRDNLATRGFLVTKQLFDYFGNDLGDQRSERMKKLVGMALTVRLDVGLTLLHGIHVGLEDLEKAKVPLTDRRVRVADALLARFKEKQENIVHLMDALIPPTVLPSSGQTGSKGEFLFKRPDSQNGSP